MAKFVRLTKVSDGKRIDVNADKVVAVSENEDKSSSVLIEGDVEVRIKETVRKFNILLSRDSSAPEAEEVSSEA